MKYFTFSELLKSDKAIAHKIYQKTNNIIEDNLKALVDNVLDPLREAYGKPINVTSGFRCEKVNAMVGGSKTSQHLTGEAADISAGSAYANRVLMMIIAKSLDYDQLIDENNYKWIHVSYRRGKNRKEMLRKKGTSYAKISEKDI